MNFGDAMKEARKKRGLSQKELGQKLGVSQAMIAQYESGKRSPKIETMEKIANALEIPVDELMERCDPISILRSLTNSVLKGTDTDKLRKESTYTTSEMLRDLDFTLTEFVETIGVNEEGAENYLLNNYRQLNDKGKVKVIEHAELLNKIEAYRKKE